MNRTYSRGGGRFKVTGRWPVYQVAAWCDCVLGPHWHLIGAARSVGAAERLIDETSAGMSCRETEGRGLTALPLHADTPIGSSSRQDASVDRPRPQTRRLRSAGARSTSSRRIQ